MVHLILREDAADIINTKCAKAGGIAGVRRWAALRNADPVVEFTELMIHELLLNEPLALEDGWLAVPTGPGLGLELDEDKIEMFRL